MSSTPGLEKLKDVPDQPTKHLTLSIIKLCDIGKEKESLPENIFNLRGASIIRLFIFA